QPELGWPLQHPRRHGGELDGRARRVYQWCRPPHTDGRGRSDYTQNTEERRRWRRNPVGQAPRPNTVGNTLTPGDSRLYRSRAFRRRECRDRGIVADGERRDLRRILMDENRVGCLNGGSTLRGVSGGSRPDTEGLVAWPDPINCIENGCRDHCG